MSSLKMTFSLASLILIFAFVAVVPVIAHVVEDDDTHSPDNDAGTDHSIVNTLTVDTAYLTATNTITATVTFAPMVAAVADDSDAATLNIPAHATTDPNPAAFDVTDDFTVMTKAADGTFSDASTNPINVIRVTQTTAPSAGSGAVFAVLIALADGHTAADDDGEYYLGIADDFTYNVDDETENVNVKITVDATVPTVSDITMNVLEGKVYPEDDVWTGGFEVEFMAMDGGSGLANKSKFMLAADPANLTFSDITRTGKTKFKATATPTDTATADASAVEVTITVTVMDKAGNSSSSTADADTSHSPMATVMLKRPASDDDDDDDDDEEETPTPTVLAASKTGLTVGAGKFILLVRNEMNVKGLPDTLPDGASIVEWTTMPNLEALLYGGGSIDLTRAKAPKLDHDGKSDTDTRDAGARDLIITEVMWAKNTALTGKSGELDHQWIEIYNPLKADVGGVTIKTTVKRSFQTIADTDVLLDRLSNQVGAGWALTGLGQDGSNDYDDDTDDVKSNFISMFRNNRGKEGWTKGHWSQSTETAIAGHKATPGRLERKAAVVISTTNVPRSPFVINEFGIGDSDGDDWVELRNVTDSEQTLKNLLLTSVQKVDEEKIVFHFHGKDLKVPAKGVVLVASTDPVDSDIAAGRNLEKAVDDQDKTGVKTIYVVRGFELPTGKFNLILRKDYNNKSGDFLPGKKLDKVVDALGSLKVDKDTADFNTDFWPLNGTGAPHGDVIDGKGQDFKAGAVYIRKNAGGGTGEHHLGQIGYTGLGYDRTAKRNDVNGGTPGFDNGAIKGKLAELDSADVQVTFSEIMLDVGEGRLGLPQWVEVYNSSMTQAVNTNGWKLHIENANDVDTALDAILTLGDMKINPNQTILIATNSGRVSNPDHFPSNRVVNLWTTKAHREALGTSRRAEQVFSTTGIYLKLTDADNKTVDEFGTLDGNRRTRDEPNWMIPLNGEDDERRSSLIRVYDEGVAIKGTMAEAWVLADETDLAYAISQTYYGDPDDVGTPGFRAGGPLPVSLSKFRPERLESGEIAIRWITESELNNAGFNILRSDTRDGEFKQINTKLIAGQGTTSEKTTYEWKDTSAKPNVVYYYQIQDVSLDGKVQTLRQSRLKGHVSPAGKLTTTWGELKALQ